MLVVMEQQLTLAALKVTLMPVELTGLRLMPVELTGLRLMPVELTGLRLMPVELTGLRLMLVELTGLRLMLLRARPSVTPTAKGVVARKRSKAVSMATEGGQLTAGGEVSTRKESQLLTPEQATNQQEVCRGRGEEEEVVGTGHVGNVTEEIPGDPEETGNGRKLRRGAEVGGRRRGVGAPMIGGKGDPRGGRNSWAALTHHHLSPFDPKKEIHLRLKAPKAICGMGSTWAVNA